MNFAIDNILQTAKGSKTINDDVTAQMSTAVVISMYMMYMRMCR